MQIERTEVAVVGAGVVGLAIAERLSRNRKVVVFEKHESFGREASSRNSQVIHAGIYYPQGSLKSRLCVKGSRLMYEFCGKHGLQAKSVGKIVPGIDPAEVARVHELYDLGTANGARDLRLLTAREKLELEPTVRCTEAFISPSSGIVDIHGVMSRLGYLASANGAVLAYGIEATRFERSGGGWLTVADEADGTEIGLESEIVVNAAGLSADLLAATAGIDIDDADYRQVPCKGEYFRLAEAKNRLERRLVYPADGPRTRGSVAAGVHLVQELDGSMKIGPNVLFGRSDLSVDENHLSPFFERMKQFLPWLESRDLRIDSAGVRAMRFREEEGVRDFIIREESSRGLSGLINLIGMESPALTASLAIADYVESLLE